jgi:NAD(P)-dependent dehydrogenase (short-subunit alcohol dehydrogenase family)
MDLTDRAAIVTGGTRGIGRAIAQALADAGAAVAVGARDAAALRATASALAAAGGRAIGIPCDVRREADCARLIEAAIDAFGRLDVLVNNAGIGAFAPVAELEPDDWRAVIQTNLDGVYYCSHFAIPHLKEAGGGWILNIGSLAGRNAFPNGAAYNATKFGLIGFSEALMQEVRYDGIRVSCIMPGSVATEFRGPGAPGDDDWKVQPEDIGRIVLDLLATPARTLPSRVEVRPSQPPRR